MQGPGKNRDRLLRPNPLVFLQDCVPLLSLPSFEETLLLKARVSFYLDQSKVLKKGIIFNLSQAFGLECLAHN